MCDYVMPATNSVQKRIILIKDGALAIISKYLLPETL